MWDYDWLGYGLLLIAPCGQTVFLQGEEASQLHDELEACESAEVLQYALSEYSVLLEE